MPQGYISNEDVLLGERSILFIDGMIVEDNLKGKKLPRKKSSIDLDDKVKAIRIHDDKKGTMLESDLDLMAAEVIYKLNQTLLIDDIDDSFQLKDLAVFSTGDLLGLRKYSYSGMKLNSSGIRGKRITEFNLSVNDKVNITMINYERDNKRYKQGRLYPVRRRLI